MSKKYDEFKEMAMSDMSSNSIYPSYMNHVTPMINHDKDLDRELKLDKVFLMEILEF